MMSIHVLCGLLRFWEAEDRFFVMSKEGRQEIWGIGWAVHLKRCQALKWFCTKNVHNSLNCQKFKEKLQNRLFRTSER